VIARHEVRNDSGAVLQCAGNSGANDVRYRVPPAQGPPQSAAGGDRFDLIVVTIKKGEPTLRKKVMCGVIVGQKRLWRRKDGIVIEFEDDA
jgi:large subunit ribosomal protein L23e